MQDIFVFLENHWILSTGLLCVLILLILIEFLKQRRSVHQLSTTQAINLINRQNATIIDLRDRAAFEGGHIIEAISLPYSELGSKHKKLEKFKNNPILLICGAEQESKKAWASLQAKGFTVYVLEGGINVWKEAGLPLVKA